MKRLFFLILQLFCGIYISSAQNNSIMEKGDIELIFSSMRPISFELKKCQYTAFIPCKEFNGSIVDAISNLWEKEHSLIKSDGNIPNDGLYYYIYSLYEREYPLLIEQAKEILKRRCRFKTETIKDSADVLILDIVNIGRLKKNESRPNEKGGWARWQKDSSAYIFKAITMEYLVEMIKPNFNYKMYDFALSTDILYTTEIPYRILKTTSLEEINTFLLENLGLMLKKEKRLEEYLVVHFYE